jgi:hypothetical protein
MPTLYRRDVRVRRDLLVLGAVAAALLVAIVAFAASTTVTNRSSSPTPTATPASERDLFGGSLEPRVRYRTRAFEPMLSFVPGDTEWLARDTTSPDYLLIERRNRTGQPGGEYPGRAWLVFSRLPTLYAPRRAGPIVAPANLYAWMRRHPDLTVGPRRQVVVAGRAGYRFTERVRFRRPARFPATCIRLDVACTAIAPNRGLLNGARMHTFVLQMSDPYPLVIDVIGLGSRDLDEIEAPAAEVLRTLRVDAR